MVNPEADETTMISVWVALLDATVENGCLQVVPDSHRGDLAMNCNYDKGKRPYVQVNIPDELVSPNLAPFRWKPET